MGLNYLPSNTNALEIANQLEEHGALVNTDVISSTEADELTTEIGGLVDNTPTCKDPFSGHNTQRTGARISRSAFCRSLATNDLILRAAHKYLCPFTRKILLHLTQAIKINPGGEEQVLHRDRLPWDSYLHSSIEPQINTIWAITDFSEENGATRCLPSSHQWNADQRATDN